MNNNKVEIFVRGVSIEGLAEGAYAATLRYGQATKELAGLATGGHLDQTELQGVVAALSKLKRPCDVVLHSSSATLLQDLQADLKAPGSESAQKTPGQNDSEARVQLLELASHHRLELVQVLRTDPEMEKLQFLAEQAAEKRARNTEQVSIIIGTSCAADASSGGYAFIFKGPTAQIEISHSVPHATDMSTLQATALLQALKHIKKPSDVEIYTEGALGLTSLLSGACGGRKGPWEEALAPKVSPHKVNINPIGEEVTNNHLKATQLAERALEMMNFLATPA